MVENKKIKKNILFIIDSLGCGGAEKSLVSLLPLLDLNKYNIDLMIISRGGIFEQYLPKGIRIIDYKPHDDHLLEILFYKIFQCIFSIKLRIYSLLGIKRHGAELYWSTMQYVIKPLKNNYDIAVAYQQGFPTYYIANNVNAVKKIAWINADITKVGYRQKYNLPYYCKYNYIIAVSQKLKHIIDETYGFLSKSIVIQDIINPNLISKLSNNNINTIQNCYTLTTVSRLVPLKGHKLAIEAARILKDHNIKFIWYFVGDGPSKDEINILIKKYQLDKNIILTGMQSNPYPYISACDIYVQPSLFEGFGMTISEAKILHKPIVSTNFDVVYNQLTHNKNGLIVDKSGEGIANAILCILRDTDLKNTIVDNLKKETNKTAITEPQKVMQLLDN